MENYMTSGARQWANSVPRSRGLSPSSVFSSRSGRELPWDTDARDQYHHPAPGDYEVRSKKCFARDHHSANRSDRSPLWSRRFERAFSAMSLGQSLLTDTVLQCLG